MEMIEVRNLKKGYRIAKKSTGMMGSLKHLIMPQYETLEAVKGISFRINEGESVFSVSAGGIRYGLSAIKSVGKNVIDKPDRECQENRRCVWSEVTALVGYSGHRVLPPSQEYLRYTRGALYPEHGEVRRDPGAS